ncbi:MAG: hypothetical protein EOM10_03710, partial [Opitutae bacterium]|nr:hypothetical protein [Opitutae bacterium]
GNIPREYIPAVEKGFKAAMENGVLAGYPVTGMKVTLKDGSYHAVDSDTLSFEICARQAFRKDFRQQPRPVQCLQRDPFKGQVLLGRSRVRGRRKGRATDFEYQRYFAGPAIPGIIDLFDHAEKATRPARHPKLLPPLARQGMAGILAPVHVTARQIDIAMFPVPAQQDPAPPDTRAARQDFDGLPRRFLFHGPFNPR